MKKATWLRASCLAFALCSLSSASSQAQTQGAVPPDTAATLQAELARINQSMAQLVALLRESMERQDLEIVLKRVELHHLALAPIHEELYSARATKLSLEEEQMRLQSVLDELEEQAGLGDSSVLPALDAEKQAMKRDLEVQLKFLKGRVASAEQRVADLENELRDGQREIKTLEGILDERLRLWGRRKVPAN